MFSVKNAMYRLVSQGERLEGQSLLSGFQEFQEWKGAEREGSVLKDPDRPGESFSWERPWELRSGGLVLLGPPTKERWGITSAPVAGKLSL